MFTNYHEITFRVTPLNLFQYPNYLSDTTVVGAGFAIAVTAMNYVMSAIAVIAITIVAVSGDDSFQLIYQLIMLILIKALTHYFEFEICL